MCVCVCGGGAGISRGGVIFIIEATAAREQREGRGLDAAAEMQRKKMRSRNSIMRFSLFHRRAFTKLGGFGVKVKVITLNYLWVSK